MGRNILGRDWSRPEIDGIAAVPPSAAETASSGVQDRAARDTGGRSQERHSRRDQVRRQFGGVPAQHAGRRNRRYGVHVDVHTAQLRRQTYHQPDLRHLGGRVGGQARHAVLDPHSPTGGREYDASVPLVAHVRDRGTSEIEWCADADRDHAVPDGALGFRKARKDDEARIVHKCIDATVSGNREFDNAFARAAVLDILITGGGNAPSGVNFRDDCVRDGGVEAGSVRRDAGIMNDKAAPTGSNQSCVRCSQTAARAGNDDDLTVKADRLLRRHGGRLHGKLVQHSRHRLRFRNHGVVASANLAAMPTRLARSRYQTLVEVRLRGLDEGARQRRDLRRTQPHRLREWS